jgi:small subunit ribosomal protein S20
MAHTLSAQKRVRQGEKKRIYNKSIKTRIKSAVKAANQIIKQFQNPVEGEAKVEPEKIKESLSKTYSIIDKALKAGVIHRNKAARLKSRIASAAGKIVKHTAPNACLSGRQEIPDGNKPAKEVKAKKSKKAK